MNVARFVTLLSNLMTRCCGAKFGLVLRLNNEKSASNKSKRFSRRSSKHPSAFFVDNKRGFSGLYFDVVRDADVHPCVKFPNHLIIG